jgi:hypothetical protein
LESYFLSLFQRQFVSVGVGKHTVPQPDPAGEYFLGKPVLHDALDRPAERPRAVVRVEPLPRQELARGVRDLDVDVLLDRKSVV